MTKNWIILGTEPPVYDVMADPITVLLMRSDRIGPRDVLAAIENVYPEWRVPRTEGLTEKFTMKSNQRAGDHQHPLCRLSRMCEGLLPVMGSVVALATLLILTSL